MVSTPERKNLPTASLPAVPEWVSWVQAGLTGLLVVLFLVMLGKSRQQSANIRLLQEQVQGLQNSRALDRTTGLEQQLRSAVERLQVLERSAARVDALSAENSSLHRELRQLRAAAQARAAEPAIPPLPPVKADDASP